MTVSSTAALEAIDAGVPVVVLSDFGVDAGMLNLVFADSGCLGSLADVRAGRAFSPPGSWLRENYFHPRAEDDLLASIESLVADRRSGALRDRPLGWSARSREDRRALVRLIVPERSVGLGRLARRRR